MTAKIAMVVAAATNNAIGKNNELLWNLPNDMKFFKNVTWGLPVVMGRKTFESFGKPLQGRTNIVITSQNGWQADGALVADNLQAAINKAALLQTKEIMVIGGGKVYAEALPITDRIYITRVHAILEGDTFFPAFAEQDWKLTSKHDFLRDEKHAYDYSFEVWDRK